MSYLPFQSKYNNTPIHSIKGHSGVQGYENIINEIKKHINKEDFVLVLETYPGVRDQEILQAFQTLEPKEIVLAKDFWLDNKSLDQQLKHTMSDDRVFGKMYYGDMIDFIDQAKLEEVRTSIASTKGLRIVYGVGASLVVDADMLVYFDLARWEIQQRYRYQHMANVTADNELEDIIRKYKRAYFLEWRIADKLKMSLYAKMDYIIDTNKENDPKMISRHTFDVALKELTKRPFRCVPYFDPGVWGGQWMKEVCNLDPSKENYAWSFDGVLEENSLLFDFEGMTMELPAMDLVLHEPKELLGKKVYARFGAEFPIRFDFLDTMEGQNLSLQVHPLTDYIHRQFGMSYTQDESYYIMDAKSDACVYLGLKENIDGNQMIKDLKKASPKNVEDNEDRFVFDAEKYVNVFPAKKHDHFLIPAGTIHASGKNSVVLEISATPYIFTFKLWDWERVGLDGLPRPIHIEHGEQVIQWDRTSPWVEKELVNAFYNVEEEDNPCDIEHTGLHELEFIETRRYSITDTSLHHTNNGVQMLNLVEGQQALVESVDQSFEPFEVHYAETFVIPASIASYRISTINDQPIKVLKAYVRT